MGKRSAQLLLFASVCLGLAKLPIGEANQGGSSLTLTQQTLAKPDVVAGWLKRSRSKADASAANRMLEIAIHAQKSGNWSKAAKAFGESALLYPLPRTMIGYAEAFLHDIASVRARREDSGSEQSDLTYALGLYKSAIVANEITASLTPRELSDAVNAETCLTAYLAEKKEFLACRPLQIYTSNQ